MDNYHVIVLSPVGADRCQRRVSTLRTDIYPSPSSEFGLKVRGVKPEFNLQMYIFYSILG